jgi:hypothetical protein
MTGPFDVAPGALGRSYQPPGPEYPGAVAVHIANARE